ncbi:MAG: HAD-IIA family hydrolase [Firmicutes bacterium]|nr:HAD-IIA family hydrolase [Bacillota bacterium]
MYPDLKGYMFDLDGVLWFGKNPIPQAKETVEILKAEGKKIMFVSNTSSRSRQDNLDRFEEMGIPVSEHELFVASEETAKHLASLKPKGRACVLGSPGLLRELERADLEALPPNSAPADSFDFLVVGKDQTINYEKLTYAFQVIQAGALLVAINTDVVVPGNEGLEPGAGAIVAMFSSMIERPADIMIGKPGTFLLEQALEEAKLTANDCVMVGDTLYSDIAAGNRLGMLTALVLTGNTSKKDLNRELPQEQLPDLVLDSVWDLVPEEIRRKGLVRR